MIDLTTRIIEIYNLGYFPENEMENENSKGFEIESILFNYSLTACNNGRLDIFKFLLNEAVRLNIKIDIHKKHDMMLCYACLGGHIDVVKFILEYTKNETTEIRITDELFVWPCATGKLEIVKLLLDEFGENINIHAGNDAGFEIACSNGHSELALFLASLCSYYYVKVENEQIVEWKVKDLFDTFLN